MTLLAGVEIRRIRAGQSDGDLTGLNALHRFISRAIYSIVQRPPDTAALDGYNVNYLASHIQRLGSAAIEAGDVDYLYRCLETLSFLGCNAAKYKAFSTVVSCVQSLVQLGREAKFKKLQCFWVRCILPPHIHAEEYLGHILTWLANVPVDGARFRLQRMMEEAYSRIRGYRCTITPQSRSNPKFWINEEKDSEGNVIPHRDEMNGMYGYGATLDYSDDSMLKEFTLHDMD